MTRVPVCEAVPLVEALFVKAPATVFEPLRKPKYLWSQLPIFATMIRFSCYRYCTAVLLYFYVQYRWRPRHWFRLRNVPGL